MYNVVRRGAARTRRGAAGGTAGTTAGRRRHRQTNSVEIIAVENVPAVAANAANADGGDRGAECVDLTCTADEEFVDLTAANDSPVVVLNSPADDPVPARRQRVRRSPDTTISLSQDSDRSSSTSSDVLPALDLEDLDDSLFREDPLQDTAAVAGPSTSNQADFIPIMSPPGGRTKVMCPVCLDSDRQISGDGRNLVSTICGHVFCNQCIRSAINNQHKCPTCRKKLTLKQTHALFI